MPDVEQSPGRGPGGVRRERTEPPHVDDPVHTRDRLESKWGNRIQDGQDETDRIRNLKPGGECEREQLTNDEQRNTEVQQVPRQRWGRVQVPDVALILVEHAINGERAAVEEHDPDDQRPERRANVRSAQCSRHPNREYVAKQRMARHDRPFGGTHMQDVGVDLTGEDAIAPSAPGVEGPRVHYHVRPSAAAAIRRPTSVKSACTDSISLQSGATRAASPPVATTIGRVLDGHSALMRRTRPSTASAVPHSTPTR